jgi:putative transposase
MESHDEKRRYLYSIKNDYLKTCKKEDFILHGYCIMSNHVHETGRIGENLVPFSNHMRRAHGRFGLCYNKRHGRLGKVAHDRPKTKRIQDDESLMRVMFYSDCNPVRAGLIKHPTDIRWKGLSSCRFYAKGEKNPFTEMLTVPEWYLKLGKTPDQRQHRYCSLLDKYLIDAGLSRDPKMSVGYYLGGVLWVEEMRKQLRDLLRKHGKGPPKT